MEFPPDDVIAAVTHLDERREKTAELSPLCEDNHTQHACAAGALCVAPSGADVSASTHRCLDCQRKIHCAMWCGENWKEYLESERCNITPNQLSAAGRASVQGSNHEMITICRVCINRLESRNADDDSDADDDSVAVVLIDPANELDAVIRTSEWSHDDSTRQTRCRPCLSSSKL